jgi:diadenosine tetraphosphatase ApaH/serine/threonine PP2A family protein phosphatase
LGKPGAYSEDYALPLDDDAHYLINPGSVGQPRDNDPRAAYVVYEPGQGLVTYYRVPYDVRKAQKKIVDAGLPDILAARLELGS